MKIKLEAFGIRPSRAHSTDAGLDLKSNEAHRIEVYSSHTFDTGVRVQLPHGTAGLIVSKSGLHVNHNIVTTGLIDEGYTGTIKVKLTNFGIVPYDVEVGDKIAQLVIIPVLYEDIEVVDELEETERGDGGFGSTGR